MNLKRSCITRIIWVDFYIQITQSYLNRLCSTAQKPLFYLSHKPHRNCSLKSTLSTLRWKGRAGMWGRQARKNQDNSQEHCAHSGAKLTAVQSRKSHTLATPEQLLFFSPPRALLTRGEAKPFHTLQNVNISIATIYADFLGSLHTSGKIQSRAKPIAFSISVLVFQFQKTLLSLNCCGSQ